MRRDHEKMNAAVEMGWTVLVYPADAVFTIKRQSRIVEQIGRVAGKFPNVDLAGCVLTGD